jgi:hypothetical protein
MELRLMDDIVVPRNMSASTTFGHPDRPPYASSNSPKPSSFESAARPAPMRQTAMALEKPLPAPSQNIVPAVMSVSDPAPAATHGAAPLSPARVTILVLKSNQVLEVTKYRFDSGVVIYQELNGKQGAVDSEQIDWRQTTQMAFAVRSKDLPLSARQTN